MEPESTYLAWIDFKNINMDYDKLNKYIVNDAGLGLNDGAMFGMGGETFQRLNFACPRPILEEGLIKLYNSIKNMLYIWTIIFTFTKIRGYCGLVVF